MVGCVSRANGRNAAANASLAEVAAGVIAYGAVVCLSAEELEYGIFVGGV